MKQVDDYIFLNPIKVTEGVYISPPENFWTYLSAGDYLERGICDWWYDVAEEYPDKTIVFWPVDTTDKTVEIGPETIYRGVWDLDEDPEILCHYVVIG